MTRYVDIGGKNIIKFNGPSGGGIGRPSERANKYCEQSGYKSQDKHSLVFFYPLFGFLVLAPSSSRAGVVRNGGGKGARPFYIPRMNY